MEKVKQINSFCRQLNLAELPKQLDRLVLEAQTKSLSYTDFTLGLLKTEVLHREEKDLARRTKSAGLPFSHDLDKYDPSFDNGLNRTHLNQLRELQWLDQNFNLVLMGPSGTGKTYIASGLCFDAVKKGYRALFRSIEQILATLKLKDSSRTAAADYTRLCKANLIVIDDIMMFPIDKNDSVKLFNLINNLYEKTSFIITTNKNPADWVEVLNDQVLATALLDRLLYRCEIINLAGESYRIKNRKSIF